jgi:hypothetical protein
VYLVFVISRDALNMDREKVNPIINWHIPRSIFEVRHFHGLVSFYRKNIRNFSRICAPSVETIKGRKQPFKWMEVNDKIFILLKYKIIENPILALPNFNKIF